MVSFLREVGIDSDMVWSNQATRICATLVDETTGSITELVEEAPPPTHDEWSAFDEKLDLLLGSSDLMVS